MICCHSVDTRNLLTKFGNASGQLFSVMRGRATRPRSFGPLDYGNVLEPRYLIAKIGVARF